MAQSNSLEQDKKDYQEYLDYQDYQKYVSSQKTEPKTTAGMAALEHYGDAALMGSLPQVQAAVEPATNKLFDLITGNKVSQMPLDPYVKRRDENIARLALQEKEHPTASTAGTVGGIVGNAIITGKMLPAVPVKADIGEKLARAALIGGAYGAANNPGDVEGVVDPIQAEKRLSGSILGGLLGFGTQGLIEGSGAVRGLHKGFKDAAEKRAFAATGANASDYKAANAQGRVNSIGRTLLDEGVVPTFSTAKGVASRLEGKIQSTGSELDNLISGVNDTLNDPKFVKSIKGQNRKDLLAAVYHPKDVAKALKTDIVNQYSNVPIQKIQPALDEVDSWLAGRPKILGIKDVQDLKKQMGKFLNDSDFYKEVGVKKQGTLAVRRSLKQGVENMADALAKIEGTQGGTIKATNQKLGNLLEAQDSALGRVARDESNRAIGLTDTISGGFGANVGASLGGTAAGLPGAKAGAVIGGIGGAAVNKFGRTFGNSIRANAYDAVAKLLEASPNLSKAAQENPAILNFLLESEMTRQRGINQKR